MDAQIMIKNLLESPKTVSDNIVEYKISSLKELQDIIIKFPSSHYFGGWLYRGQADQSWELKPKAGREPHYVNANYTHRLHAWCREAIAYTKDFPDNEWEQMALAQHHGLATNLLDWTGNPLAAMYFACSELGNKNGAMYCYFPTQYVTETNTPTLNNYKNVVGYIPRIINPRLKNQNPFFTFHPDAKICITPRKLQKPFSGQQLKIITIDKSAKSLILEELNLYGINRKFLFPDLDGLSAHYNWLIAKESNKSFNGI